MKRCPLCGYTFEVEESTHCSACPMQKKCTMVCCPHCGYSYVEESRLIERLRRRGGEES
jgi:hypothetical protein